MGRSLHRRVSEEGSLFERDKLSSLLVREGSSTLTQIFTQRGVTRFNKCVTFIRLIYYILFNKLVMKINAIIASFMLPPLCGRQQGEWGLGTPVVALKACVNVWL